MKRTTFEAFEAEARAQGFDEVIERQYPPSSVIDSHTHPFSVRALLVQWEMCLTVGGDVRHLRPGDEFTLEREVAHMWSGMVARGRRTGPLDATVCE